MRKAGRAIPQKTVIAVVCWWWWGTAKTSNTTIQEIIAFALLVCITIIKCVEVQWDGYLHKALCVFKWQLNTGPWDTCVYVGQQLIPTQREQFFFRRGSMKWRFQPLKIWLQTNHWSQQDHHLQFLLHIEIQCVNSAKGINLFIYLMNHLGGGNHILMSDFKQSKLRHFCLNCYLTFKICMTLILSLMWHNWSSLLP